MRKLALLSVAFALVAVSFYGCDENPAAPTEATIHTPTPPLLGARGDPPFSVEGGAIVTNGGKGYINCHWGGYTTGEGSVVVTPAGNWKIDCTFKNLPDYWGHRIVKDWRCTLCVPGQGCRHSYQSLWVQTGNNGHSYCHFNGKMRWDG
jgi:hypothetical protein